jgi:predicted  nucleic acid-binding Zn-ribbon protein
VSVQEIAILNEALENAESEIRRLRGELDNAQDEIVLRDLTIKRLRDGRENDPRCRP